MNALAQVGVAWAAPVGAHGERAGQLCFGRGGEWGCFFVVT